MSIRCVCPNGHALRVKVNLAGKTGICPKCEAEFRIPNVSQPATSSEPKPTSPSPFQGVASPADSTATPPIDPPPPEVEWRAANPAGEQFGPTIPAIFTQWLEEGRVQPDWLIWRTGWPEWRRAAEVVDQLPAPLKPIEAPPPAEPPQDEPKAKPTRPAGVRPEKPSADVVYLRRKQRAAQRKRLIVGILAVVCLGLTGMLIALLISR